MILKGKMKCINSMRLILTISLIKRNSLCRSCLHNSSKRRTNSSNLLNNLRKSSKRKRLNSKLHSPLYKLQPTNSTKSINNIITRNKPYSQNRLKSINSNTINSLTQTNSNKYKHKYPKWKLLKTRKSTPWLLRNNLIINSQLIYNTFSKTLILNIISNRKRHSLRNISSIQRSWSDLRIVIRRRDNGWKS